MPPSVRFTSVDQRTYNIQSDDSDSTVSLVHANDLISKTMLPKELSSVHLTFVDGRNAGDEIEFGTTTNIALGNQLDEYRRKAGRLNEPLSFEYGNASVMGTETPKELGMKDEDWIYVFPTVTPEIHGNQDEDEELQAQIQELEAQVQSARREDDGETAADDEISENNEVSEDNDRSKNNENSNDGTAEDAHVGPTGAITSDELGTIITSESRIISLLEAELDFVNRNSHLVVTKAHDGRTNMFISTQSKEIPIPPAPRKHRHASATRDAGNATSGDIEIQDDKFDAYQELTTTGSVSPEFVPGSRPRHNHNTNANSTEPNTRPTGLGRPTKTGTNRAPYGSKKAARTKKQKSALADAAIASRTLQAEVGDNAAEMASHSGAAFVPTMSGFDPDNIDPQLAGLAPYCHLPQAGAAFQPDHYDFLDEEDRAILDANANFDDITDLSIPSITQADLDAQFPSDVIVPMTLERDQNIIYQDQDAKGKTPEHDCVSDEENADMDTDTSMLDQEADEQAILDADTTFVEAIKYVDPDYAASLMGGPKLSQKSARASKSKANRTPQRAPRAAAKPKSAAAGNGVSTSKASRNIGGRAKAKNADTGAGVVKSAVKAPKSRGRAAARKKRTSISDEVVLDDGDEEEET
ncbi:hypothetical protein BDV97DRAFT_405032 [Delphinella strobiligena]|nr:hypothetical protein BDV97DRAFT_405032 [Delphinella strobiligena]